MPTIRISETSWKRLKAWAEPLEDTADSALAKILDAAERHREPSSLMPVPPDPDSGPNNYDLPKLPQREFREPILQVIYELGGSARRVEVFPALKNRMEGRLLAGDLECGRRGKEKWRRTAINARRQLVETGYLRDDSPRGVWALSHKGTELVESGLPKESGNFADHLRAMPEAGEDSDFDRSPS